VVKRAREYYASIRPIPLSVVINRDKSSFLRDRNATLKLLQYSTSRENEFFSRITFLIYDSKIMNRDHYEKSTKLKFCYDVIID